MPPAPPGDSSSATIRGSWPALLLAAVLIGGALVVVRLTPGSADDRASPGLLALFLVALVAAAHLTLDYSYRGELVATHLFEAALAPVIFTLSPGRVVALAAAGIAIAEVLGRVPPIKATFNIASWSAAAAAGAGTFRTLSPAGPPGAGHLPALVVALLVTELVSLLALVLVIATTLPSGKGERRRWLRHGAPRLARDTALPDLVNVTWGVLFVATFSWASWTVALFVVPLTMLHWANKGYALGRVEQDRLLGLQRATRALSAGPDLPTALPMFLAVTAETFDWEMVELVVPTADGRLVDRCRPAAPTPYEHRWEAPGEDSLAALLLAGGGTGPGADPPGLRERLDSEGWGEVVLAPLTVPDRGEPLGLLCGYDRGRATAFPAREGAAFSALAAELAGVLARAEMHRTVGEERATLDQIVRSTADGIATLGPGGTVQTWNPAFEQISGYLAADVAGTDGMALLRPRDDAGRPVSFDDWPSWQPDGHGSPPQELAVRHADGHPRWLSCTYSRTTARGSPVAGDRLVIVARDVTSLRLARRRREAESAVFEQMAARAPLPVALHAVASALAPAGSGLQCAVLLRPQPGRDLQVVAATDRELFDVLLRDSLTPDAGWAGAALRAAASARGRPGSATATTAPTGQQAVPAGSSTAGRDALLALETCWAVPVLAVDGEDHLGAVVVVGHRRDAPDAPEAGLLTKVANLVAIAVERRRAESRLSHLATHDTVTGLPNRVMFLDRCQHALDRARRDRSQVVVLFLDLDRFKVVNDSLGHDAGDRLLVACAKRLGMVLRPGDTVARFGGDEFTILCDGTTDEGHIAGVARRIQLALGAPFTLGDSEVFVTASIGVAVSYGGGTADALVGDADAAMYRAKEHGGNRWELFDAAMRARATERMTTQSAMHRGLERGEFEVHYQPIISLPDRAVSSAEALLRWRHPDRGLLLPADYLPQAESSGLIVPIGRHVMRTACLQARRWQRSPAPGRPRQLSINLSAREFVQPDLVRAVAEALDDSGADPAGISFEVTESAAMDDAGATVEAMHELKALGVGLTIDDFGTGYSSLTYLKRFPVNGLKVDRSFVAGLARHDDDDAIVTAVIELAHSLGLRAVAEGVETEQQMQRLQVLGCDAAQGFHLGRPQPATRF